MLTVALLILSALFSVGTAESNSMKINYAITEETNIGSFVGNLLNDARKQDAKLGDGLIFKLYDDTTGLFRLEEDTGKLLVAKRIDREDICPEGDSSMMHSSSLMSNTLDSAAENYEMLDTCQVSLTVIVHPDNWINIGITVQDINDNTPQFIDLDNSHEIVVEISESVDENYSAELVNAVDHDVGQNSIQRYYLEGSEIDPNIFTLSFNKPYGLNLIVLRKLDAEVKQSYSGLLKACDGGRPKPRCGSKPIVIKVSDENDNMPIFKQKTYNKTISEDLKPGTVIAKVEAEDKDVGVAGDVLYSIGHSPNRVTNSQFGIKPKTGEVFLRSALDARQKSKFEIALQAKDGGAITHTGYAKLIVNVLDVNNNRPWIKQSPATFSEPGLGKSQLYIEENRPVNTLAGLIVAGDDDLGDNGRVECMLKEGEEDFELSLTNSAKNKQVFKLVNKKVFDREKIESGEIPVKVKCVDKGEPPLTTEKLFKVHIIDINEFSPVFQDGSSWYTAELYENAPRNTFVFQVRAIDDDSTAELHYELTPEAKEFFRIDSKSGRVFTGAELDRERQPEIKFEIIVTDKTDQKNGTNSDRPSLKINSARASASVTILDVNDNKPKLREPKEFKFTENEPAYADTFRQLIAFDPDNGENGTVSFKLLSIQSSNHIVPNNTFLLDENSGKLFVQESLDREKVHEYTLKVELKDRGRPSLSDIDYVIVKVQDVNDHNPRWLRPNNAPLMSTYDQNIDHLLQEYKSRRISGTPDVHELGMLNISAPLTPGQQILQLMSEDADAEENANCTYQLTNIKLVEGDIFQDYNYQLNQPDEKQRFIRQFFSLNEITGELIASAGPKYQGLNCDVVLEMNFRVNDNGTPKRSARARLFLVIVRDETAYGSNFYSSRFLFGQGNLSFKLIILMVSLTCLISLCLLIAIIIVRRRASKDRLSRSHRRRLLNQNGLGTIANGIEIDGNGDMTSVQKWARENVYVPGPYLPPTGTLRPYLTTPPMNGSSDMLHENGLASKGIDHVGYYSVNSPLMNACNTDSLIRKPHSPTHTQVSQLGSFQSWSNKSSN